MLGWDPLEHREAALVMHEIADRVDEGPWQLSLGFASRDMGSTMGSQPVRSALWMEACFPAWTVLASSTCV